MKAKSIGIGVCIAVLIGICTALPSWTQEKKEKKDPAGRAALVNGEVITQKEFDQEIGAVKQRLAMNGENIDEARSVQIKKDVLKNMINRELLYQESKKKNVVVDEAKVDEQIASFKKKFPDDKAFQTALEKMQMSEDIIKKQIREQMAIQELVETKIVPTIQVADEDIKTYYDDHPDFFKQPEQVKASHILIKVDPKAKDEDKAAAKKKIADIQEQIKAKADFAELAKKYSEGPSAVKGGDLGLFRRGMMVKPFEDVAFSMKEGEVSDLVETQFGYHLVKVTEKKPAGVISFDDAKDRIHQVLKRQRIDQAIQKYLEEVKKTAKIETFV